MTSRALSRLLQQFAGVASAQRDSWLAARLMTEPRCPVARYLTACRSFETNHPAEAVRHMMISHHAEPQFESAGLMVFAGLNWVSHRGKALLPVLLATWEEFRRPEFDRTARERILLDACAEPIVGLERLSLLARRLWRIPIQSLRRQLRTAVQSGDASQHALLLAPA